MVDGFGITDAGRKKNLLLFYAGEEVEDIADTLDIPDPPPPPEAGDQAGDQAADPWKWLLNTPYFAMH